MQVTGEFVDLAGERWYAIHNVDKMAPFFVSVVSNVDHWLFVSSTGGLSAGRVSPDTALFPYVTVDKINDSATHTGSKTLMRISRGGEPHNWAPFNIEHDGLYSIRRNLYKNTLGNKLCFEEINHDLGLEFRYTWSSSEKFGFVRDCELRNLGNTGAQVELLDGVQNILPAGTPRFTQTNSSYLVDAYKWSELDVWTGLAMFTLYSGISDRAEPCESLKANTLFCLGLSAPRILLSSTQVDGFFAGNALHQETRVRGVRGAYFINHSLTLAAGASQRWQLVADVERSQSAVVALRQQLADRATVAAAIQASVDAGSDELARIMATADGFQATAEETVHVHHYANVLFNVLRGGIFDEHYTVSRQDFLKSVAHFNLKVYRRDEAMLRSLPERMGFAELLAAVRKTGDLQLQRLCHEYLPITFGRRHGDPSRPWNQFKIELKDDHGSRLLTYEGNWRDIFQNWEALTFSFPEFVENVVAKFVNASTMEGYNPYRITNEGIDWEVEEDDNPWSYIGYWGDHQIIYLLKLLELSEQFHPARLGKLLREAVFCYANVPYRIKPFAAMLENPKNTVTFDEPLAARIESRVAELGADGKLVLDAGGEVYQVNLLEKLLVPLLCKLGNLVVDGGIWLNTQRPEWNDANNALVGQGLSMVTLYYMRRYIAFLQQLLESETEAFELSTEVSQWLAETARALRSTRALLGNGPIGEKERFLCLSGLGEASSHYRQVVYAHDGFTGKVEQQIGPVREMLEDALAAIDHSIACNRRDDGLYHAYNLMRLEGQSLCVDTLYPMLEGQVAVLSAGAISSAEAVTVLDALFASEVYRADQHSFMLYPDRPLPSFLEKNRIDKSAVESMPILQSMLAEEDSRVIVRDADGQHRFNADFRNVADLNAMLDSVQEDYGDELVRARKALQQLFEQVFGHQAFTGRSGGMFGFEGLGCIYWHMVSKLLLAVQENFFAALADDADKDLVRRIGLLYYRVREGLSFNKTPLEYGAFPTDPYSHTPKHAGAQQPGMTGQVKEEVLSRFGELGVRVHAGQVSFQPALLRECEFVARSQPFRFLDIDGHWQELALPSHGLAFTWCQVPVVYRLDNQAPPAAVLTDATGNEEKIDGLKLSAGQSAELFRRSGRIRKISVGLSPAMLFDHRPRRKP